MDWLGTASRAATAALILGTTVSLTGSTRQEHLTDNLTEVTLWIDRDQQRITLLRSRDWVQRIGASVGKTIALTLSESKQPRAARVVSIKPATTLSSSRDGRMVTAVFESTSSHLQHLTLKEPGLSIRATANHPMRSRDRQAWIPAGQLRQGEYLATAWGSIVVDATSQIRKSTTVFNLEVESEHHFYVTPACVMVHNRCAIPSIRRAYPSLKQYTQGFDARMRRRVVRAYRRVQMDWLYDIPGLSPHAIEKIIQGERNRQAMRKILDIYEEMGIRLSDDLKTILLGRARHHIRLPDLVLEYPFRSLSGALHLMDEGGGFAGQLLHMPKHRIRAMGQRPSTIDDAPLEMRELRQRDDVWFIRSRRRRLPH